MNTILTMVLVAWSFEVPVQVTTSIVDNPGRCVNARKIVIKSFENEGLKVYTKIDQKKPKGDIVYMSNGKDYNAILSCTSDFK